MAHTVGQPVFKIPRIEAPAKIEDWSAPSDEEIKRRRKFSVVIYAPNIN